MDQLLQDIINHTKTGEEVKVVRDSIIYAIDPIREARNNSIALALSSMLRDTNPWQEFIKWCECHGLEFKESIENYGIIYIRKKPD